MENTFCTFQNITMGGLILLDCCLKPFFFFFFFLNFFGNYELENSKIIIHCRIIREEID
jgi:hypothetical protein